MPYVDLAGKGETPSCTWDLLTKVASGQPGEGRPASDGSGCCRRRSPACRAGPAGCSLLAIAFISLATASGCSSVVVSTRIAQSRPWRAPCAASPGSGPRPSMAIASVAMPRSLRRIASSQAISSNGYRRRLTPAMSTPVPMFRLTPTLVCSSTTRFTPTRIFESATTFNVPGSRRCRVAFHRVRCTNRGDRPPTPRCRSTAPGLRPRSARAPAHRRRRCCSHRRRHEQVVDRR